MKSIINWGRRDYSLTLKPSSIDQAERGGKLTRGLTSATGSKGVPSRHPSFDFIVGKAGQAGCYFIHQYCPRKRKSHATATGTTDRGVAGAAADGKRKSASPDGPSSMSSTRIAEYRSPNSHLLCPHTRGTPRNKLARACRHFIISLQVF